MSEAPIQIELTTVFIVIGRVLLGSLFVIGGARHFLALPALTEAVRAKGVPSPGLALIVATVIEIAAGLALMLGRASPWASLVLIAYVLMASVVMLDFWNQQGEMRTLSINVWQSNVALIGGLLIAAVV